MKQLAGLLLFFGAGSIVLNLVGMEFTLLMWMDAWGEATSWFIKIGMLVAGAGLWLLGHALENPEEATA